MMLNANHFPFVLDLACSAARREFLKLDKWITDKIKEHKVGVYYIGVCVHAGSIMSALHSACKDYFKLSN